MTLLSRCYSVGKRLSLEATLGRITAALPSWEAASNRGGLRHADAAGCEALCEAMGSRQRARLTVHVAGSKGKGTVCALVGAALQAAGRRVGVLSSPHVESYAERVRVDGSPVAEGELVESLDKAMRFQKEATFFDVFVAASFDCLRRARCDVAVVR
jgi:dihydrofolate synthase/folylpolyglutamate synthase